MIIFLYNSDCTLISARAKRSSVLRDMKIIKRTARNTFHFLAETSISYLGSTGSYCKKLALLSYTKEEHGQRGNEKNQMLEETTPVNSLLYR